MEEDESREQLIREWGERWAKEREERDEDWRRLKRGQTGYKTSTTAEELLHTAYWISRAILLLSLIAFLASLGGIFYFGDSWDSVPFFIACIVSGITLFFSTSITLLLKFIIKSK